MAAAGDGEAALMDLLTDAWSFLTTADNWSGPRGIAARGRAHVWISVVATVLAGVLAIPPAIWLAHRRAAPVLSIAIVNIGRAVPSFAIIALVLPLSIRYGFGLGFWPTCIALVALGIPPMFTNSYAGVASTPPELVEAARGVGMRGGQVLRGVELPNGLPLVLTGIRISAVQIVATATLGALVGYDCLGTYIVQGLRQGSRGDVIVFVGALLVATLAIAVELVLDRLEPMLTPWARRVR
jgi:osmoprotectant transport system permease protein